MVTWPLAPDNRYRIAAKATVSAVSQTSTNASAGDYGTTVTVLATVSTDINGFILQYKRDGTGTQVLRFQLGDGTVLLDGFPIAGFSGTATKETFWAEIPVQIRKGAGPLTVRILADGAITGTYINMIPVRGRAAMEHYEFAKVYGVSTVVNGTRLPAITSIGEDTAWTTIGTTVTRNIKMLTYRHFLFGDATHASACGTFDLGFGTTVAEVFPIIEKMSWGMDPDEDYMTPQNLPNFRVDVPVGSLFFARQRASIVAAETAIDIVIVGYS